MSSWFKAVLSHQLNPYFISTEVNMSCQIWHHWSKASRILFSLTHPASRPPLARRLLLLGIVVVVVVASASSLSSHLCLQHLCVLSAARYQKESPRSYFVICPVGPADPDDGKRRAKFKPAQWRRGFLKTLALYPSACAQRPLWNYSNCNLKSDTINLNFKAFDCDKINESRGEIKYQPWACRQPLEPHMVCGHAHVCVCDCKKCCKILCNCCCFKRIDFFISDVSFQTSCIGHYKAHTGWEELDNKSGDTPPPLSYEPHPNSLTPSTDNSLNCLFDHVLFTYFEDSMEPFFHLQHCVESSNR